MTSLLFVDKCQLQKSLGVYTARLAVALCASVLCAGRDLCCCVLVHLKIFNLLSLLSFCKITIITIEKPKPKHGRKHLKWPSITLNVTKTRDPFQEQTNLNKEESLICP